jgi:hypothetical protein
VTFKVLYHEASTSTCTSSWDAPRGSMCRRG